VVVVVPPASGASLSPPQAANVAVRVRVATAARRPLTRPRREFFDLITAAPKLTWCVVAHGRVAMDRDSTTWME
jgi:hypothetical protein